jgi:hypothetical protein
MDIKQYIKELNKQYQSRIAREHICRPVLQQLLAGMLSNLMVLNKSARQICGDLDYIHKRKNDKISVTFIEVNNINYFDLVGRNKNKEQFTHYDVIMHHQIASNDGNR